jgi:hypothetical protein
LLLMLIGLLLLGALYVLDFDLSIFWKIWEMLFNYFPTM